MRCHSYQETCLKAFPDDTDDLAILHPWPTKHDRSRCWLAIGSTVIATILWNYGLKSIPVSQAGLFLYLIPFISVTAAGIFLRESISPGMLLGGVFIIIGVVLAQLQLFTKSTLHTHIPDSLDKEPATPI